MLIVFKIRRISDGLFSNGGAVPSFTKNGKIWKQKGHITSHFNQLDAGSRVLYKSDCELVQYEITEVEGSSMSIMQYMDDVQRKKDKREADATARSELYKKEERRKAYEALKSEFE